MNAVASRATSRGSSPNERVLMMGLSGLELTSSTGAKFRCTPTARASRAVTRPTSYASAASPMAPSAITGGNDVPPPRGSRCGSVYPPSMRIPGPLSMSVVTRSGTFARRWIALSLAA